MIHKNIMLNTSNENKIKEFKRFGLPFSVSKGVDIKEIQSDIDNVILHKALDSAENILVEDTVLIVNGEEVVDIRWKIKEIQEMSNPDILWVTSLAIKSDGFIYIYRGKTQCSLIEDADKLIIPNDAFGFDPLLKPIVNNKIINKTFYQLEKELIKDNFSPRKIAVENLLSSNYMSMIKVNSISKWTGLYQND